MRSLSLSMKANKNAGEPLPTVFPQLAKLGAHFRRGTVALIAAPSGVGKAQRLDEPIITPGGWRLFGDLDKGDYVFSPDGKPVRIVGRTQVWDNLQCYKVVFSDGAEVECSAQHEWTVEYYDTKKKIYKKITRETQELLDKLRDSGYGNKWSIPRHQPLEFPRQELPVDPYVLGVWLGDGTCLAGSITNPEEELWNQIREAGYSLGVRRTSNGTRCLTRTVLGLQVQLRDLGVLGNKHIPKMYLSASIEQRLALLQGLMDTDASIAPTGRIEYCTTDAALADGVSELLSSLGIIHKVRRGEAKLYGVRKKDRYRIVWTGDLRVFRLERKAERLKSKERCDRRYITDIRPVESSPMRCIHLESDDGLYLVSRKMVPTHNTLLMSHWSIRVNKPGIYMSFDSDIGTVGTRMGMNLTGRRLEDIELAIKSGDPALMRLLEEKTRHISWTWDAIPDAPSISEEIDCYGYIHGEWPHWIIFDNLADMAGEDPVALNAMIDFGKQLARKTDAFVCFLHHVAAFEGSAPIKEDEPIGKRGLRFKLDKQARLILTLHRPTDEVLGVSVVKNSSGKADSSGRLLVHIPIDLSKQQLLEAR